MEKAEGAYPRRAGPDRAPRGPARRGAAHAVEETLELRVAEHFRREGEHVGVARRGEPLAELERAVAVLRS
jgi:hypothetical protein